MLLTHTTDVLDQFGPAPLDERVPTDAADIADARIEADDYVAVDLLRHIAYGFVLDAEDATGRIHVRFFDPFMQQYLNVRFAAATVTLVLKRDAFFAKNATAAVAAKASTTAI